MCGIAGILNLEEAKPIGLSRLNRMAAVIQHRGPDETGIYVDDWVGLSQTRLSIIDLSSGTQPIHNETKTMWIIFNGEVFNYPELREQLEKDGHRFYTTSDTEVILHLYESEGPACIEKLNGQFAIAIWDAQQRELFIARDRVGIRPLHYTTIGGRFFFASEIKSLFVNPEIPRQLDAQAIDQTFTFWTTLAGKTAFQGIQELPPGHYLRAREGSVTIHRYWDLPFAAVDSQVESSSDDLVEEIRSVLLDAIRIRLRADVPVGTYLSGGLDSSGVTALVKKNFNNKLRSFGIRFEQEEFDEGRYQSEMVSYLDVDHMEITATNQDIGEAFPRVLWHCEKPLLRTSPAPLFLLSDLVNRNGFKVVLTGEGADEVFAGYNIFRETKVRRFWARQPDSKFRPLLLARLYPYILNDPKLKGTLKSFFGVGLDRPDDPFFSHFIRWRGTSRLKTFFCPAFREELGDYDCWEDLRGQLPRGFESWDYLAKAQFLEMSLFLSNYLLSSQGDRVAMAHSLEIRLPYLDFRLIELMGRVKASYKIAGLNEKALLKRALEDVLPASVVERDKHPYRAPIKQSLLNAGSKRMFSPSALRECGVFDENKVPRLISKLERFDHAGEFDSMALTGVLSTHSVFEKFVQTFDSVELPVVPVDLLVDRRENKNHSED
jgi:asparagine synthase (glutamine-hydrolysing)